MAKFNKGVKKETPAISTSSLPDVVYMLLFFFMVSTTMREVTLLVESSAMPDARQITKLEKKSLVSNIYIGKPKDQYVSAYGTEPRVQLNDKIARVEDIIEFVTNEKASRSEEDQNMITNNLKVHMDTKMGIITDVKQELRKANSLRVSYATRKKL